MGFTSAIAEAAAITSGGPTQDFTVSGFGTPKAAMFVVTKGVTLGTSIDDLLVSIGFTDGTRERCFSAVCEHGLTTSDNFRRMANDEVIQIPLETDGTIDGEANFDSFITDGVRINWGNLPSAANRVVVYLFKGDNLSVHVNDFTSPSTQDASTDVTDPGFEPHQVICVTHRAALNDTAAANAAFSLGFCDNGASVIQKSVNWLSIDALTTTACSHYYASARVARSLSDTAALAGVELTSFDSNGFSATTRDAATNTTCIYLALRYGDGEQHWIETIGSPNISSGNFAWTDPGFTPQLVLLCPTEQTAEDTFNNNFVVGGIGLCGFTATEEFSCACASEQGQANTDTISITEAVALRWFRAINSIAWKGTFVSMDANGWTINISDAFSTGPARQWMALAVETEAAVAEVRTPAGGLSGI